jgi:hypothetical protein
MWPIIVSLLSSEAWSWGAHVSAHGVSRVALAVPHSATHNHARRAPALSQPPAPCFFPREAKGGREPEGVAARCGRAGPAEPGPGRHTDVFRVPT